MKKARRLKLRVWSWIEKWRNYTIKLATMGEALRQSQKGTSDAEKKAKEMSDRVDSQLVAAITSAKELMKQTDELRKERDDAISDYHKQFKMTEDLSKRLVDATSEIAGLNNRHA